MRRVRMPSWSITFVLPLLVLTSRADAAADLDGDWQLASDTFLRCSRTGSDVTCQALPTLLMITGTNDVVTGNFSFVVPPAPPPLGSGSVPPGPDGSYTGTVAPDGQTFTGTLVFCAWETTYWQCSTVSLNGSRFGGPAVCGNGLTEPGERCDQGTAGGASLNGDQCCSATCDLVDPDGDLICSRFDDCPVTSNVDQTDTNHDGIGDACDPGTTPDGPLTIRRLQHRYRSGTRASMKLDATYAGPIDVPSVIEVSPVQCGDVILSTSSRGRELQGLWGSRTCTVRATSARCKSRFEDLTLKLTVRRAGDGVVRLKLSIAGLSFCSPGLTPPAHVGILHAGGSRGATISSCVVRTSDAGGFWTDCAP